MLCGPGGDQRQTEVQAALTVLNLRNRALLPASLITLTLAFVACSLMRNFCFRTSSRLHFLTCTIIRTIHPSYSTFTLLINEDTTSLTEQLFSTSKITPNYQNEQVYHKFLKTEPNLTSPLLSQRMCQITRFCNPSYVHVAVCHKLEPS